LDILNLIKNDEILSEMDFLTVYQTIVRLTQRGMCDIEAVSKSKLYFCNVDDTLLVKI
jgi:hypothetical protein